jgi:hypothetical protein
MVMLTTVNPVAAVSFTEISAGKQETEQLADFRLSAVNLSLICFPFPGTEI